MNMNKRVRLLCTILLAPLAGCTVVPQIQYKKIEKPQDMQGMADAFFWQESAVTIQRVSKKESKDAAGNVSAETEISITSTPKEHAGLKVGVVPVRNWRSSSAVTITKVPNTDLVSSVDVEVTDNTVKVINEWGGAIVKVVGAVAALAAPQPQCVATDRPIVLDWSTLNAQKPVDGNGVPPMKGCITIALGKLPPDAAKKDAKTGWPIPWGINTSNYYYAACRDVTITIDQTTKQEDRIVKTLRISDPEAVQFVQLPAKGTITSHSACGVSVKTEKATANSSAAIVDALATQGKAIKDALEASGKK